ncbi:hypothetical protein [Microbulbifer elongatus]|uniref:hypothetical protein n=1 Tax=Microbulbifer elongatus TaxID=86173 RepID=UPI001E5DD64B|nr:hypothetical protein [Microbulbifer elongatus]
MPLNTPLYAVLSSQSHSQPPLLRALPRTLALIFACLTAWSPALSANTATGWSGYTGGEPEFWLSVAPSDIRIEAPTPLTGSNLQILLALSGSNSGLGEMRKKANDAFGVYLKQQVQQQFGAFFDDERVRVVEGAAPLTLHTAFDVTVRQKILDIFSSKEYDVEKGTMTAYGKFHYRLLGSNGDTPALREGSVDIADLKLQARYRTKAPKDGGTVEDTTREATERLLEDLAEELLDELEDILEADALQELARM